MTTAVSESPTVVSVVLVWALFTVCRSGAAAGAVELSFPAHAAVIKCGPP